MWADLLILTHSGGTAADIEFFTSIRNWRQRRRKSLWSIRQEQLGMSFLIKTIINHHCCWDFYPNRHQFPPTISFILTQRRRRYLLSRNGYVVECRSLQRQSDVFAVLLNLTEDGLNLPRSFLQHREAGQVWEELCLIPWPAETHTIKCASCW